jgi:hypothetical protein
MGDTSDFQRGWIVGPHLAVASVTKMATLLGVSRTDTHIMGMYHQLRGIVAENQN